MSLAWNVHAALTTAQVSEHFGRCIRFGLANDILTEDQETRLIRGYAQIAKVWVPSGTFGTQAERLEGVQAVLREMFTAQTGLDGTAGVETDGTSGKHIYKRHWLKDTVGLTGAEIATLEP